MSTLTIDRSVGTYVNTTIIDNSAYTKGATITGTIVNDVITAGAGADTVNAGKGADVITLGAGLDTVIFASGDTAGLTVSQGNVTTASSFSGLDIITDFAVSNGIILSETFDTVGTASLVADTTSGNGADVTTYTDGAGANVVFATHTINNGIITFVDSGSSTITVSAANLAGAISYLQGIDLGDAGATVAFVTADDTFVTSADADTTKDLVIFTQGTDSGSDNTADVVVGLINAGTTDALITGTNTVGANDLYIM